MWLRARDTLHRICDMAEEEGVIFTLENLNLREHPGCPFNSTGDVLSLVSAVNRPQLRINLDLYHTQIGEGDVIRWAEACLPWVGEIQVADNPGRFEPGTGEMNWPMIARALNSMGYDGPVGMEAYAKGDPRSRSKPSDPPSQFRSMPLYHNRPHVADIRAVKARGEMISMLHVTTPDAAAADAAGHPHAVD